MSQALYEDGLLNSIAFLDLSSPRSRTNSFNLEGSFYTIKTNEEEATILVDIVVAIVVVNLMLLPLTSKFRSINELEKHIYNYTRTYSYVLSIAITNKQQGLKYTFSYT